MNVKSGEHSYYSQGKILEHICRCVVPNRILLVEIGHLQMHETASINIYLHKRVILLKQYTIDISKYGEL
ncbi:hypothetical protein scyTo_0017533 [Scyliorhinus torazame]|uniref:Uncharacterized protein n=1 Tax=Scyliorhinus torazame TaxID=75743 RepID=A0A401PV25_SCYTO|nr:hypothetical protein [Scyliorhinus torazame]